MALNKRIDGAALKEIHHFFVVTAMFGCWRIVFRRPFMSTTSLQLTLTSEYAFTKFLVSSRKYECISATKLALLNYLNECLREVEGGKS